MSRPQRILCVCQGGHVRSVSLRFLLNYVHGFDSLACGWEPNTDETKRMLYDWADTIIVMETAFAEKLPADVLHKVMAIDVGPDVWGASLHPDLMTKLTLLLEPIIAYPKEPAECDCGHARRRHDPEDGYCEAGAFPPCSCGYSKARAARSRAALEAQKPPEPVDGAPV